MVTEDSQQLCLIARTSSRSQLETKNKKTCISSQGHIRSIASAHTVVAFSRLKVSADTQRHSVIKKKEDATKATIVQCIDRTKEKRMG